MWISELSRRSGVPVATVKYYLRDGLLPPGESTGATRAVYSEAHVERLRLIRALVEVGGMRLAQVRAVLEAVDGADRPLHDVLGMVQDALTPAGEEPTAASVARVDALVERVGWEVAPRSANRTMLARALDALDRSGDPLPDRALDLYAATLSGLAEREVASIETASPATAIHQIVVRTVLVDPVLLTLRRMAHAHVSAGRLRELEQDA